MRLILIHLILAMCMLACESPEEKRARELNDQADALNQEYRGKKLWYPEDLRHTKEGLTLLCFKIVTYYDGSCTVCYDQLKLWKKEIAEMQTPSESIQFRFILSTNDSLATMNRLEQIDFPIQYVTLDMVGEFVKRYPFVKEKAFNTFFVDIDQKIEFIGSPLASPRIKEIYMDALGH